MNYLKNYPDLVKLYNLANDKVKKQIIEKIIESPSDSDGPGYVYGFTKSEDKNTRYNFYMKLGRTSRNEPSIRINEWGGEQVFSIKSIYNKKFERLVHLFFKFANIHRDNKKNPGTKEVEWFRFIKVNNINKNFIISRINSICSLIDDIYLLDDNDDNEDKDNIKNTVIRPKLINNNKNNNKDNIKNTVIRPKINLKTCSKNELLKISGIGNVLANAIINYRECVGINDIGDLIEIRGIGDKRLDIISYYCEVI